MKVCRSPDFNMSGVSAVFATLLLCEVAYCAVVAYGYEGWKLFAT